MQSIAMGNVRVGRITYILENGILYRQIPGKCNGVKLQLFVPCSLREQFLKYFHDSPLGGHMGRLKTLLRLLDVAYWPQVRKDVWEYTKSCIICQQFKPVCLKPAGMLQSTSVKEPGEMLGVDLMGPFPRSKQRHQYLFVVVDYCSKWVELFPIRDSKTPKLVTILIQDIFTRWGSPLYLVSDRGAQFTSQLIKQVCRQWGVVQKLTTSYHPQTNLTERVNRTIKTMISSYVKANHANWDQWLTEFRFAINSATHESTGFSPAEIALGRKLKGPLERLIGRPPDPEQDLYTLIERQQKLLEQVKENVYHAQSKQARYYNPKRRAVSFQVGDKVWVRDHPMSDAKVGFAAKLAPKWRGPATIKKRLGPVNYQLVLDSNPDNHETHHIENIKIFFGPSSRTSSFGGGIM
ncbi:UNVERIFIED_CONTAM: hypothetical protein FKN15_038408 [Acipenser sinensis]